ncbi:hypothetical protein ACQJBY_037670 [Aegilops geniculata]
MATPGSPHGTTPSRRGRSAETHQKRTSSSRNTSPQWPAFAATPRSSCCSPSPSRAPPPWPRATSPAAPPRRRPRPSPPRRPARSRPSRTCRRPPSPRGRAASPAAEAGCRPSRASAPSRGSPCPGWGAGGAGATAGPTAGTRAAAWRPPPPSAPRRAPATGRS